MFVCKSISLANYLIEHKSKLVKIDRDKMSTKGYLVFLFENDDILNKNLLVWRNK